MSGDQLDAREAARRLAAFNARWPLPDWLRDLPQPTRRQRFALWLNDNG